MHAGNATVAHHHYPTQAAGPVPNPQQPTTEQKRSSDLAGLKLQLSELVSMKTMLPVDMQGPLDVCITKVTTQVRDLVCVSDVTE